jgi:uncharacterized membrane protein YkvI
MLILGWIVSFVLAAVTPFVRAYYGHSGAVRVPMVLALLVMVSMVTLLKKRQLRSSTGVTAVASATTAGIGLGMIAMGLLAGRPGPVQFGIPWLLISLVLSALLGSSVRAELKGSRSSIS